MNPHQHTCQICGHSYECEGVGKGKLCEVDKAVKANKQGPFCEMCRNFIMFKRVAEHRGKNHNWIAAYILDKAEKLGIDL